jgi:hypothetical protein
MAPCHCASFLDRTTAIGDDNEFTCKCFIDAAVAYTSRFASVTRAVSSALRVRRSLSLLASLLSRPQKM